MLSNRRCVSVFFPAVLAVTASLPLQSQDVAPTFLHRRIDEVQPRLLDVTTANCRYKPLFGLGDAQADAVRGIARFGEIIVDPGGASAKVLYPAEEQIYFVLEGSGTLHYDSTKQSIRADDFMYLPPGIEHGVSNPGDKPLRVLVMGYNIPPGTKLQIPSQLLIANTSDVKKQVVGNHPGSTLYQLLVGDTNSKRDVIAAGHVVTSLFIMTITPGGTNTPHSHPSDEEIYLILEGRGEMVAGGGMDGIEGRHPVAPGDAYFVRPFTTVGYYADKSPAGLSRVLAVRSRYPHTAGR